LGRYHFKFTKRPSCKYTCFISDIWNNEKCRE
jgi:hypothetical protein